MIQTRRTRSQTARDRNSQITNDSNPTALSRASSGEEDQQTPSEVIIASTDNDFQSQTVARPSEPPACPALKKGVLWSARDIATLIRFIGNTGARNQRGKIIHAQLQAEWKSLKEAGWVDAERTASALLKKYSSVIKSRQSLNTITQEIDTAGDPSSNGDSETNRIVLIENATPANVSQEQVVTAQAPTTDAETEDPAIAIGENPCVPIDSQPKGAYSDYLERVQRNYKKTVRMQFKRPSVPIPKNVRVPQAMIDIADKHLNQTLIELKTSQGGVLIHSLNNWVYATALTVQSYVVDEKQKQATAEWFKKNKEKTLVLNHKLGYIRSAINMFKEGKDLTRKQAKNLKGLKLECKIGWRYTPSKLRALESEYLNSRFYHERCTKLATEKSNDLSRRKQRSLPLAFVRRGKSEDNSTPIDAVRDYWQTIIGAEKPHNENSTLLTEFKRAVENEVRPPVTDHQSDDTNMELWKRVFKKMRPWKATGPDGIYNFWWKILPSANANLREYMENELASREASNFPAWLSEARAITLFKGKGDRNLPQNHRTIAVLNSQYKVVTGMLTQLINHEIESSESKIILPRNQMALKKGIWGCTHAHIIERCQVVDSYAQNKHPLSIAWVDYTKAFDSIPHQYIFWILKTINISERIIDLIKALFRKLTLVYEGRNNGKLIKSKPLQVKNGVPQGDTLSPLLFCLCISPISHFLNEPMNLPPYHTSHGMVRGIPRNTISYNHLFYVDDLVLFYRGDDLNVFTNVIAKLTSLSLDIGLTLNIEKSAQYHTNRPGVPDNITTLPTIGARDAYTYLGIDKSQLVNEEVIFTKLSEGIRSETYNIWKSELTFSQKVTAYNQAVISKAKYVFANIIVGTGKFSSLVKLATNLDKSVRQVLGQRDVKAHFKKCCLSRLYIPRAKGGYGLQTIKMAALESIVYSWCYLATSEELKNCYSFLSKYGARGKRTLTQDFDNIFDKILADSISIQKPRRAVDRPVVIIGDVEYDKPTTAARIITAELRRAGIEEHWTRFLNMETSSRVLNYPDLDLDLSFSWLKKGMISSLVVRNITAAQEDGLRTNAHVGNWENRGRCRACCSNVPYSPDERETAEHLLSICTHWRTSLMIDRHNSVARNIYHALCVKHGLDTYHYRQPIDKIRKVGPIVMLWDCTLGWCEVKHNRPDIVVIDDNRQRVYIIEVSVSWATHLSKQECRKYAKYAANSNLDENESLNEQGSFPPGPNLKALMGVASGYRTEVYPIVIGTCGEISINTMDYLSEIGFTHRESKNLIERMSRSAVLGSHRIIKAHMAIPPIPI